MNKKLLIGSLVALIITLTALGFSLSEKEESNIVVMQINDSVELSLLPISTSDYCARHGQDLSDEEAYEDYIYYTMKLKSLDASENPLYSDLKSKEDYGARVAYFTEQIGSDLELVQGADTLSCILNHMERTYNIRPELTLNLVFEKKSDQQPNELIWHNNPYTQQSTKINLN